MIKAKCIQKFRDKQGKIYGYRIQDLNGVQKDISADALKHNIKSGIIYVTNLQLTSDNRLVNKIENGTQHIPNTPNRSNTPNTLGIDAEIEKMVNKAKMLDILTEIPTYCNHKCYIINNKSENNYLLLIPSDVRILDCSGGVLSYKIDSIVNEGNLKVIGGKNLEDARGMFEGCRFNNLDLSKFITTNLVSMQDMFRGSTIPRIDLSKLNVSKVTDMREMFHLCIAEHIDLSSFKISDNVKLDGIFDANRQFTASINDNRLYKEYNKYIVRILYNTFISIKEYIEIIRGHDATYKYDIDYANCRLLSEVICDNHYTIGLHESNREIIFSIREGKGEINKINLGDLDNNPLMTKELAKLLLKYAGNIDINMTDIEAIYDELGYIHNDVTITKQDDGAIRLTIIRDNKKLFDDTLNKLIVYNNKIANTSEYLRYFLVELDNTCYGYKDLCEKLDETYGTIKYSFSKKIGVNVKVFDGDSSRIGIEKDNNTGEILLKLVCDNNEKCDRYTVEKLGELFVNWEDILDDMIDDMEEERSEEIEREEELIDDRESELRGYIDDFYTLKDELEEKNIIIDFDMKYKEFGDRDEVLDVGYDNADYWGPSVIVSVRDADDLLYNSGLWEDTPKSPSRLTEELRQLTIISLPGTVIRLVDVEDKHEFEMEGQNYNFNSNKLILEITSNNEIKKVSVQL